MMQSNRVAMKVLGTVSTWWLFGVMAIHGAEPVDFNTQIRPLLTEHCIQCHGPDEAKREADFRIDTFKAATTDHDDGHAGIVPGNPDQSEVIRRIESDDADTRMPPTDVGDRLNDEQIALLKRWIAEGARFAKHWAYEQIRTPKIPNPSALPENATNIDRFIVASLEREGLRLSAPVSKTKLIRRATFDLTGLPPSWDEVSAFVNDNSEDAFAKVVNRLLESPRYGERWGRHWLDIARYADTHGGGAIGFKTFAFSYTYRDYVIDAFNNDLPYDRFVMEQLAADQLGLTQNDRALAALGFLTIGRQYTNIHDIVDDRIDVVTRGLLGLTVACARCHDHKYDAIPTTDYYELYAAFANSKVPQLLPLLGEPKDSESYRDYQQEFVRRQLRRDETAREQSEILRNRLRMQVGEYLKEIAKGTPEQDLATMIFSYRTDDLRPFMIEAWRKYLATTTVDDPVFGPWHRLAKHAGDFSSGALELIAQQEKENGDLSNLKLNEIATEPPRWNPRVLSAIRSHSPKSMLDLADAYGKLFAEIQEEWLRGLMAASLEARADTAVVPDQDTRHTDINSSVNRQLRFHLYAPASPIMMTDDDAATMLNRPISDHVNGLDGAIHELHLTSPGSPPRAMVLLEDSNPSVQHVFTRGNPLQRGPIVKPRFLDALSDGKSQTPFQDSARRRGLAEALVDPANPLTRRVIVNWVWQRHFGFGLVRTPDDFGTRGEPPTHPDLLDHLAQLLLDDHWSIKSLHRRIMMSQVYQQASVEDPTARLKDPQNRLLWRMPRRRLELEAMRDAMLAVSGDLDETKGGRPFDLFAEPITPRRSVYGFVNRDVIPSLFSTFDMADPSVCVAKRPETTVPQQTLFALNSEFIQQQAKHLANLDTVKSAATDADRIIVLYQRAFSRLPSTNEIEIAVRYIRSQSKDVNAEDVWPRLAHVLLASNEFVFLD